MLPALPPSWVVAALGGGRETSFARGTELSIREVLPDLSHSKSIVEACSWLYSECTCLGGSLNDKSPNLI